MEKRGLTQITHHLLRFRTAFQETFDANVKRVGDEMHELLGTQNGGVEGRNGK